MGWVIRDRSVLRVVEIVARMICSIILMSMGNLRVSDVMKSLIDCIID